MLVEDRAAFVERLEVPVGRTDKHRRNVARAELEVLGARWEVRLAESAALELERILGEEASVRRIRSLRRELGSIRKHLRAKRDELAVRVARLDRLEAKARARSERRPPHVMFRLHSGGHHLNCSERRFGRLSARQLDRPVFVMKKSGSAWWWYLNRCWWDDGDMRARDVAELVLRRDLQRMLESDALARARSAVLEASTEAHGGPPVPDSLHLSVWSRYRGRCVECGSDERVNFDRILATSQHAPATARNFELRCQQCRDRRDHNKGRARIGRARIDALAYHELD